MRHENTGYLGHICNTTRNKVSQEDETNGNSKWVSLETGEEFSERFLREGVSPRRTQGQTEKIQVLNRCKTELSVQNPTSTAFSASDLSCFNNQSDYGPGFSDNPLLEKMKILCSFGGRILPRPNDGKLRYVGGETKIISIRNSITYNELVKKTTSICNHPHTIKYQLPYEELDMLISISCDEDLRHMTEEYYDLEVNSKRLRIFLVPLTDPESPCSSEARSGQQVVLDPSFRRISSKESLTSPLENNLKLSYIVPADSSSSSNLLENRNGSCSVSTNIRIQSPTPRNIDNLQVPSTSFIASSSIFPANLQQQEPQGSQLEMYKDLAHVNGYISSNLMNNNAFKSNFHVSKEHFPISPTFLDNSRDTRRIQAGDFLLRPQISDILVDIPRESTDQHSSIIGKTPMIVNKMLYGSYGVHVKSPETVKNDMNYSFSKKSDFQDEILIHSQPGIKIINTRLPESCVVIEDVTGSTPPDIFSRSAIVPLVHVKESYDILSNTEESEGKSEALQIEFEDYKVNEDDIDNPMSEALIFEMEAGKYGLQIIENGDLEDVQELGSGTYGTVYHGKWRGTDVAIKRIKRSCFAGRSSEKERLIKDFWREAQILSKLHHPNVVAFYGVVADGPGGTLATVTEFMVDGSLKLALLKKDRLLDQRKKLMIALSAAFGMEYLHLKNIVHFDLKCDNLLVNLGDPQRPVCKVGDFGLSRIKRNTFVSGGIRGTLPWMAPELLSGSSNRVSEKVDIFSFGITMWEILTGEEPYANMHCGEIIGGIVNNTLRPPIPKRCNPEWKHLMEECWSHDPEKRPSFTEITNKLRDMIKAVQPKGLNRVRR